MSAVRRLVPRELRLSLVCGLVATALAVALLTLAPPSGDAPSHLFQTWLYRHGGFQLWNNRWYGGRYEFVSYSVLYYPLAVQAGELPVLAAALAAGFAAVSTREWGRAARGPAIAFAVTTTFVLVVSGSYPFTAGAACACLALLALQRRRRVLFAGRARGARVLAARLRRPARAPCRPPAGGARACPRRPPPLGGVRGRRRRAARRRAGASAPSRAAGSTRTAGATPSWWPPSRRPASM